MFASTEDNDISENDTIYACSIQIWTKTLVSYFCDDAKN